VFSENKILKILFMGGLVLLLVSSCVPQETPVPTPSLSPTAFVPVTAEPTPTRAPSHTPTLAPTLTPTDSPTPESDSERVGSLPDPDGYQWSLVADGFTQPIGLSTAGDGSGRLFVIEKPGQIRIIADGNLVPEPFLDIRDRVGASGSEQGLLGLAFHPDYESNGYIFVNYTDNDGDSVVSRFSVSSDENRADPESESRVLVYNQPYKNHNGGQVLFGPDGYLWITTGDGGAGGDPDDNAQNLDTLLGKLLRLDVDQQPYSIPEDNPFGDEIWAYGLRNPWRITFDPATGELYIADVGQNQWEEINYLPADALPGANFGWDYMEGNHAFEGTPPDDADLTGPVAEYNHAKGCSVSGGAVYRGSLSDWQGVYLYGDFCSGIIWGLLKTAESSWQNEIMYDTSAGISAISQDEAGEVYMLDIQGGVYRLEEK